LLCPDLGASIREAPSKSNSTVRGAPSTSTNAMTPATGRPTGTTEIGAVDGAFETTMKSSTALIRPTAGVGRPVDDPNTSRGRSSDAARVGMIFGIVVGAFLLLILTVQLCRRFPMSSCRSLAACELHNETKVMHEVEDQRGVSELQSTSAGPWELDTVMVGMPKEVHSVEETSRLGRRAASIIVSPVESLPGGVVLSISPVQELTLGRDDYDFLADSPIIPFPMAFQRTL
jgi:hypothetical protein